MYPPVVTKDPTAVEVEVQAACRTMFPDADLLFVPCVFGWAIECFTGNYRDYQAVDTRYHDFEHTLQGTLCLARLLRGRHAAGAQPQFSQRMFQLGLVAILLHDTGYLKKRNDLEGTGAKYTVTHVHRSADFAAQLLQEKGFTPADIKAVQNMISCTGVNAVLSIIPFQSEAEKVAGFALGTADLLGQMAAEDYVDKLPTLYAEFAEAARHSKDRTHFIAMFSSAEDLMRKTPAFWEKFVRLKLDRDFGGLHRFLNDPCPSGPNWYFERIEANLECLRQRITVSSA
jgi:predicted metal-dependent HD superfamily phosphohydrolase